MLVKLMELCGTTGGRCKSAGMDAAEIVYLQQLLQSVGASQAHNLTTRPCLPKWLASKIWI